MNAKTFLILSLVANIALGAALLTRQDAPEPAPAPESPSKSATDTKPSAAVSKPNNPAPEPEPAKPAEKKIFTWEDVESDDYRQYIANLRKAGVPEDTIRDIIIADVTKLYAKKKKDARGKPKPFEFWKPGIPVVGTMDTDAMEKMAGLEKEKNEMIKAMGFEPDIKASATASAMDQFSQMLSFLPDERQSQVQQLMMNLQQKAMKAQKDRKGMGAMLEIQQQFDKDLKAALSDEEYRDYSLRLSQTSMLMRMEASGYEPTKDEFLAVFELRKSFDEKYPPGFQRLSATPEQLEQHKEAMKVLNEDLKAALGDDRYADYQLAQKHDFRGIVQSAEQAGLGLAEAKQAYEIKTVTDKEVRDLRRNRELSQEQRAEALLKIRAATEDEIKSIFGDNYDKFNRGGNAMWLNSIK